MEHVAPFIAVAFLFLVILAFTIGLILPMGIREWVEVADMLEKRRDKQQTGRNSNA